MKTYSIPLIVLIDMRIALSKYIVELAEYDILIARSYPLSLIAYLVRKLFVCLH